MKVLMCPPKFFSINYEINPWMDKENQVDQKIAQDQWDSLVMTYSKLGVDVQTIDPVQGLPDMVFTANAGLVVGRQAIVASFKYPERRLESAYFAKWFSEKGFEVHKLEGEAYFEGQGEALAVGDTLVAGYGFRANYSGHERLNEIIGQRVTSVRQVDPRFYHLDTCFLPINSTTALYFPDAFDDGSRNILKGKIPALHEVSHEEAAQFICNSVVFDKTIVMPYCSARIHDYLQKMGFEVLVVNVSEFRKSGGGVRCLTLNLD